MINGYNMCTSIVKDRFLKKAIKKVAKRSLDLSQAIVRNNPRLKSIAKAAVGQYIKTLPGTPGYNKWLQTNFPDYIEISKLRKIEKSFKYRPLISVIVPTYNTPPDFLRECLDSVIAQVYENWELCIVDDASTEEYVREIIGEYVASDPRIKAKYLKKNLHIAGASNKAIEMASGDFIALFDHDDLLWPNALFEVAKALNADKTLDFIYTDEDKITEDRFNHLGWFFKPDWNPDFLHSVNYITHFSVIRKTLLKQLGGLRKEYNGAQDWDLFLRVTDSTKAIKHIPKIVYSWRIHDASTAKSTDTKPYVVAAQKAALKDDLKRKGIDGVKVEQDPTHSGYWKLTYPLKNKPLVSIVIPSKNQYRIIKRCIGSIYKKSTYQNFEIILVDTGSDDSKVTSWYKTVEKQHANFRVVNWHEKPFSYARSCNEGARVAKGEIIIMLNNDTEVITPDWIETLASEAQRSEVGAVGCLLFFPDGVHIQHAGIGVGLGGVAANSFSMMTLNQHMSQTQHLMINTRHNMTAVTAACLAIRKKVFDEINGFDETYRVTYNDVDLCLRLHDKGYHNVYTPYARLLHHESISVGLPEEVAKRDTKEFRNAKKRFITQWQKYVDNDPNLNPNLSKDNAFYDIRPVQKVD